jgi:hypothetical protein
MTRAGQLPPFATQKPPGCLEIPETARQSELKQRQSAASAGSAIAAIRRKFDWASAANGNPPLGLPTCRRKQDEGRSLRAVRPGQTFAYEGRSYRLLPQQESRAPGLWISPPIAFESACATCGAVFRFSMPANWQARGLKIRRYCPRHAPRGGDARRHHAGKIRTWHADGAPPLAQGRAR